jgi:hypothetical protein
VGEEVMAMEQERNELVLQAVDLGDIDTLEEDITPCTGCGCDCRYGEQNNAG